jgi:hypothetical protein
LITFFFGASVNVSELIPDKFTPITILSIGLLLFTEKMKRRDIVIISIVLIYSISVHSSHLLIDAASLLIFYFSLVYEKIRKKAIFFYNKFRRLTYISDIDVKWKLLISFFLLTLYFNGAVSTISCVAPRFQSKVVWLLP